MAVQTKIVYQDQLMPVLDIHKYRFVPLFLLEIYWIGRFSNLDIIIFL